MMRYSKRLQVFTYKDKFFAVDEITDPGHSFVLVNEDGVTAILHDPTDLQQIRTACITLFNMTPSEPWERSS